MFTSNCLCVNYVCNAFNFWMRSVCALERLVGFRNVRDYCVVVDPEGNFAFILCPEHVDAEELRARYVIVGDTKFFELVKSVVKMPYYDEGPATESDSSLVV